MLAVLTDCCSKNYLDMMKHAAMSSSSWNMLKPIGLADKHLQLPIIENEVLPNTESLSGMALGLLIQIFDSGGKDCFHPEVSYCAISMKDRHRTDNRHVDHANDPGYIKVLGLLNSDWGPDDGGLFLHGHAAIPMVPTSFVLFDPKVQHCASEITTDKKRLGLDFTVKKK